MPYVFDFDHTHPRPPMELKDLLGGKGANLAEMTSVLALPVPPGFTISTDACRAYMASGWPKGLDAEVAAADVVVVASPTYKAAYTGMLKAFLDRYGNNGLAGTVAVPVMTGGWAGHSLAVDGGFAIQG